MGDNVLDPSAPILRSGAIWQRGGFACLAVDRGFRCVNAAGHGFFLSRARWKTF